MGVILEVDLSKREIEKRLVDTDLLENFLGGKGFNVKFMWDRVGPEVGAFSPDNLLILGTGALVGTIVPGAAFLNVTFKSPITGMLRNSTLGGFFSAELKRAGYDTIIITGKSPTPVYIWINNEQVEIRDASHLWGKNTNEAQNMIRRELKNDRLSTIAIGPAGENRVYFASIESAGGGSASRGGAGAVMGDKKLKAIAVRGTGDMTISQPLALVELCEHIVNRIGGTRERILEQPRPGFTFIRAQLMGDLGYWNQEKPLELQEGIKEIGRTATKYINDHHIREVGCANCALRCKRSAPQPNGHGYTSMKCGDWSNPMSGTYGVLDLDFAVQATALIENYGMDINSTWKTIAFAISMFEKGILTKKDTEGIELEWRNPALALSLVDKIVHRQGIGDTLANGIYLAAKQIGRGAEDHIICAKKMDISGMGVFDPLHMALATAVCENGGDITKQTSGALDSLLFLDKERKQEYIKAGWFPYPQEFQQYFLEGGSTTDPTWPIEYNIYDVDTYAMCDICGVCVFWLHYWPYPAINDRQMLADLVSYMTGVDMNTDSLLKIARRTINLVRSYNCREGKSRKDDYAAVPRRAFELEVKAPREKLNPEVFDKMLDMFYQRRGWNTNGIPTRDTLMEYGLDYVAEDLERRQILI